MKQIVVIEVLGGFEPPSLDSESRVLTVTPQDPQLYVFLELESQFQNSEETLGLVGVRTRGLLHAKQT